MLCSIITVSKNNLEDVIYTLESFINEPEFKLNSECLVIDDSEGEDIRKFVQSLSHKNIKWVKGDGISLFSAMNIGIKLAKGKYIWFLNSGDRKAKEINFKKITEFSSQIVYGNTRYLRNKSIERELIRPVFKLLDTQQMKNALPCHQSMLFERKFLVTREILYDDTILVSADYKFVQNCVHKGASITYYPIFFSEFSLGGISTHYKSFKSMLRHAKSLRATRKLSFLQYIVLILKLCRKISFKDT